MSDMVGFEHIRPEGFGLGGEGHGDFLGWVRQSEGSGVQGQGAVWEGDSRAVFEIADNGVAAMGKLEPDLVVTTCVQFDLDPGGVLLIVQAFEGEFGQLAAGLDDSAFGLATGHLIGHFAVAGSFALDQSPVNFLYLVLTKLGGQSGGSCGGTCECNNARGGPVEAVDEAQEDVARFVVFFLDKSTGLFEQIWVPGVVALGEDAGRFANNEEVVVEVKDV
jgi:hypothetical protein